MKIERSTTIPAYVELDITLAKNYVARAGASAGWQDWDISASDVPASARFVEILIACPTGGAVGTRAKGSAQDRRASIYNGTFTATPVGLKVQTYDGPAASTYYLLGYWT